MSAYGKRKLLDDIVPMLKNRQLVEAADLWRKYQKTDGYCVKSCPYEVEDDTSHCARCLEGSFRTMSLVTMENRPDELVYWGAAGLIHDWLTSA